MTTLAYCLYVTGVVAIQIYSAHQVMEEGEWDTNPHLLKMALLSVALCSIQDFAATMMHIDELINFKVAQLPFRQGSPSSSCPPSPTWYCSPSST